MESMDTLLGTGLLGTGCGALCVTGLRPNALSTSLTQLNLAGSYSVVVSNMVRSRTLLWVSSTLSCSPIPEASHGSTSHSVAPSHSFILLSCSSFLSTGSSLHCCLIAVFEFAVVVVALSSNWDGVGFDGLMMWRMSVT